MPDFDLFVIGGGSGGVACARRAASHGAKVGLAEQQPGRRHLRDPRLRAQEADALRRPLRRSGSRRRGCYGWDDRRRRELAFERLCEARNTRDRAAERHLHPDAGAGGRAAVPGACAAARRAATATAFVVARRRARRSRPRGCWSRSAPGRACPSCPGIELASPPTRCWRTSIPLPERLAVVGAGYIGLELASILNALGVEDHADPARRPAPARLRARPAPASDGRGRGARRGPVERDPGRAASTRAAGRRCGCTPAAAPSRSTRCIYATGRSPVPQTAGLGPGAASVWRCSPAARSPSMPPTEQQLPASSPSATAATMPARRWTACRST